VLTTDGLKVQLLSEILCGKGISLSKARQSTMLKQIS
jgi:transcription initiation factor TFIID subunit 5